MVETIQQRKLLGEIRYMLALLFLHEFCIYRNDDSFTQQFSETLANEVNFESFYFECPPVNAKNMNEKSFEFVIVNSGTLHKRRPDPHAFAEHFKDHCLTSVSPIFIFFPLQNFIQTKLGNLKG